MITRLVLKFPPRAEVFVTGIQTELRKGADFHTSLILNVWKSFEQFGHDGWNHPVNIWSQSPYFRSLLPRQEILENHVQLSVWMSLMRRLLVFYFQCSLMYFSSLCRMGLSVLMCMRGFWKGSERMCERVTGGAEKPADRNAFRNKISSHSVKVSKHLVVHWVV